MEGVVAVAFLVGYASNQERPGSGRPPVVMGTCRLMIGLIPRTAPRDAEVLIGSR